MGSLRRDAEAEMGLPPGFRFHPTDEELVVHYLCRKAASQRLPVPIIAEIDLYKFNAWELPVKALFGQREWYFFTPRDRKYPNGSRPNRAAGSGYWKATGADKPVSPKGSMKPVGIKKALVFYVGKAPKGIKTDWIMHEYRLADSSNNATNKNRSQRLDNWVLCRLYNKKNAWEKMQQQKEAASMRETMCSMEVNGDTGSDSLWTNESDIDYDAYPEFNNGNLRVYTPPLQVVNGQPQRTSINNGGISVVNQQKKEEHDWFTDLNLDELQGPVAAFPSVSGFDIANPDYLQTAYTPPLRPGQINLQPF